jgi:hypothetical protein
METEKRKRVYKPFRVLRVTDIHAPHGVDKRLILEVYPNGLVYLREHGRRVRREVNVAKIYVSCIMRDLARLPRKKRCSA